ncbi:MAG TPA: RHS repeat protein, partial [Chromatiales bacterium]|nr:RHS repeat protein [Chromatiales bacterium]
IIKEGKITEYGNYDVNGNPGYKIEAIGMPEEKRIDYTYDPRFAKKIMTITEPSVYADRKKVTTYTYDDMGNLTRLLVEGFQPDGTPVSRQVTMQYNGPFNQLTRIDGPRTDVQDLTSLEYYPNDPAEGANRARLRRVIAGGIIVRDNIQYTPTGKVASEQRATGQSLLYTYYPGNDRLATLTIADGVTSRTTRWSYLPTGEVETITQADGTPESTTVTLTYDDARRLIGITDHIGNNIKYQHDTAGNRIEETVWNSSGTLAHARRQVYDELNRLTQTIGAAGQTTSYGYDANGNRINTTDANNNPTRSAFDALNRLITVTDALNGTAQYAYDNRDNLTAVTDPNGNTTSYAYDDLGNLLSRTSPTPAPPPSPMTRPAMS